MSVHNITLQQELLIQEILLHPNYSIQQLAIVLGYPMACIKNWINYDYIQKEIRWRKDILETRYGGLA